MKDFRALKTLVVLLSLLCIGNSVYTQTVFYNSAPILFPDVNPSPEAATPFPSEIEVTGQTGLVSAVKITLHNFTHDFPDAVDILLQSPSGIAVTVMSDVGAAQDISNIDITITDSAISFLPDNSRIFPGSYKPTNIGNDDIWPSNTPVANGTTMADFNGFNPNGTWKLFASSDVSGGTGSIDGGWSVTVYTDNSSMLSSSNINFAGAVIDDLNVVELSWRVDPNFRPDSVRIEHSIDNLNWNKLATQSHDIDSNHFTHIHPAKTNYYRMIFFHLQRGVVSNTIVVKRPNISSSLQLFPNPAKHYVYVSLPQTISGVSEIQLLNMSGDLLKSHRHVDASAGRIRLNLDAAPGKYLLRIKCNDMFTTRHLVITP